MDLHTFKGKIDIMRHTINDSVQAECVRLFLSGAVDVDSFKDDFSLPKIILSVALANVASQFMPPAFIEKYDSDIKNLEHF